VTIALVFLFVVAVCVLAPVLFRRIKHPEDIEMELPHTETAVDPLHSGDERPAGPDAEDTSPVPPNRFEDPPPPPR
jgi:hypothetical protein